MSNSKNWIFLLTLFVSLQAIVMAINTPLGAPPDELAHLSYVKDVISNDGILPDYSEGTILGSARQNYMGHPPLYYSALGLVGSVLSLDAVDDYLFFRLITVFFVSAGLLLFIKGARKLDIDYLSITILLLACSAIPMFSYLAGSVNNDNLVYLGFSMVFYGVASSRGCTRVINEKSLFFIFLGAAIVFLTKATASAYLVFFILTFIWFDRRRIFALKFSKSFKLFFGASVVLVGGYYIYSLVVFGGLFPKPGNLYDISPPQNPLTIFEYVSIFLKSMWDRLPVIMSHQSIAPLNSQFLPFFYIMVLTPLAGYLLVRFNSSIRTSEKFLVNLSDSLLLAAVITVIIHIFVTYPSYLSSGLLAGMQPRYYSYLIPVIWIPFFITCTSGRLKKSIVGIIGFCVLISFWATVPFVAEKQSVKLLQKGKKIVFSENQSLDTRTMRFFIRQPGDGRGHIDKISLNGDVLSASGWIYDIKSGQPANRVTFFKDNLYLGSTSVNITRPDVEKALSKRSALNTGYSINISNLPHGTSLSEISVIAEYVDGTFAVLYSGNNHVKP